MIFEPFVSNRVVCTLMIMRVDFTVHLDTEPGLGAIEVENVWTDRMLATKNYTV